VLAQRHSKVIYKGLSNREGRYLMYGMGVKYIVQVKHVLKF
jgi:hypothetical protein